MDHSLVRSYVKSWHYIIQNILGHKKNIKPYFMVIYCIEVKSIIDKLITITTCLSSSFCRKDFFSKNGLLNICVGFGKHLSFGR